MGRCLVALLAVGLVSALASGEIAVTFSEQAAGTYLNHVDGLGDASRVDSIDGSSILTASAALLNVDPIGIVNQEQNLRVSFVLRVYKLWSTDDIKFEFKDRLKLISNSNAIKFEIKDRLKLISNSNTNAALVLGSTL